MVDANILNAGSDTTRGPDSAASDDDIMPQTIVVGHAHFLSGSDPLFAAQSRKLRLPTFLRLCSGGFCCRHKGGDFVDILAEAALRQGLVGVRQRIHGPRLDRGDGRPNIIWPKAACKDDR